MESTCSTNSNSCFFEQKGNDNKTAERGCWMERDMGRRDLKEYYNISDSECIKCNNASGCYGEHDIGNNKLLGTHLNGNAMLCFCKTDKCNDHCEYNKSKCKPIKRSFVSNESNDTQMEKCDARELCGTQGDGTTKDTTTMTGENGRASVTEGDAGTKLADVNGGTDESITLVKVFTFIYLIEKIF